MLQQLVAPDDTFRVLLTQYRRCADLSQNHLAHRAGLHPSYVSKLEAGGRRPPGRDIIHRLAAALDLDATAEDRLLLLAGYAPYWLVALACEARVEPRAVAG